MEFIESFVIYVFINRCGLQELTVLTFMISCVDTRSLMFEFLLHMRIGIIEYNLTFNIYD